MKSGLFIILFSLIFCFNISGQNNIVEKYGQLSVQGNYIIGQYGDTVQLRGMSLFWSQWMSQFYDRDCIRHLADKWKCTVVRAAMGVEMGGYLENRTGEKEKVMTVVDAAIKQGIYVIIDYHSHEAHENPEPAKKFFAEMAKKYGHYPNVIYEIYNEPLQHPNWKKHLKPYSEEVIKSIRQHDPDNIIVCGTRQWSQMVSEAAADPIKDTNIAYTLHFYAGTHKKWLRDEAKRAMDMGIALFVTEFGTCHASGNGYFDPEETQIWFDFMDKYKISWCNWSVADKDETASILKPGANGKGGWADDELTESGKLIKEELIKKNGPLIPQKKKK
ncbi:MAG: glycoside hydrolase family 5 protein [Cytophagaceae bacterium]